MLLYYITDRKQFPGDESSRRAALLEKIAQAARCGVDFIQLREKDLSGRELGLLETLLRRAGRLVSKEQLVDHLCEWGDEVSNNAIEVYVHRLRKKLEPGGVRIATVRGLGYCLERPGEGRNGPEASAPQAGGRVANPSHASGKTG